MNIHPNPKGCDLAYEQMIDYFLSFGLCVGATKTAINGYSRPFLFNTIVDFEADDLVVIGAANSKEYRLSWLKEQLIHPNGEREFLLQCAKTGNQCWWSNVGLNVLDRKLLEDHPDWKWTNEQWEFEHRWTKIQREQDEYIIRTYIQSIDENNVEIRTRTRYSLDGLHTSKIFLWRDKDDAFLTSIHEQILKGHEDAQELQRKQRDSQAPT